MATYAEVSRVIIPRDMEKAAYQEISTAIKNHDNDSEEMDED